MKRIAIVLLAVCALLAVMAPAAYASYNDSDYVVPSASPHGNFTLTSTNCAVCHAVHHAEAGGEALLRGTVAGACTYCHITSDTGYIRIYNDDADNYNNASEYAHDAAGTATCVGCHQVHAAAEDMVTSANGYAADEAYLVQKILKDGVFQGNVVWTGAEADGIQVSKWCTRCHPYWAPAYGNGSDQTHVMTTASANYAAAAGHGTVTAAVATNPSSSCHDCHNRGLVDQTPALPSAAVHVASSYPHFTDGKRFLSTATDVDGTGNDPVTNDATDDGVCMRCHRGAALGGGAGINW